MRWKDSAGGRSGVFNLYLLEPVSMWKVRAEVRALCQRLQAWREHPHQYRAVRAELESLQAPQLGEVTCLSPRRLGSLKVFLRMLGELIFLALAAGISLHAEIWYLCTGVFALRLFMSIPYWRYRDRPPAFAVPTASNVSSKALAAGAAGQKSS